MAQLVKNPPARQETWVRSLGREDPLEKGKATHSSILAPGTFTFTLSDSQGTFTGLVLEPSSLHLRVSEG